MTRSNAVGDVKATPGPWVVGETFTTHNAPTRFWETRIHSASGAGPVATAIGASREEAEANASRIVAIHDLYEVLDGIASDLRHQEAVLGLNSRGLEMLAKADAALTKARGERNAETPDESTESYEASEALIAARKAL